MVIDSALDHDESEENDYIMKAIMRVLHVGAADVQPFLDALLHKYVMFHYNGSALI